MTAEDERKNQQVKKVYIGVIILLILMFIGIFAYSLDKVLAMEGSFPGMFTQLTASVIADPGDSTVEATSLLSDSVDKVIELRPQVDEGRSFSFVDSEEKDDGNDGTEEIEYYETDASDSLSNLIQFLKDDIESSLEDSFECKSCTFGESSENIIVIPDFEGSDVVSATCTYKYYECASCGEKSDSEKENCELCGYAFPYTLKYKDDYTVVLELKSTEKIASLFSNLTCDEAKAILSDKLSGFAKLEDLVIGDYTYSITYGVNRLTGELSYYELKKEMIVSATFTCVDDYASVGKFSITDKLVEKNKFSFTWPGIELDCDSATVEPGKSSNLLATLRCDNPTEYTIAWSSSDSSVITVDEEGYYKASKDADGKYAIITASFEFNGVVYEDSCTITVQVPVESMALNKRSVKLSVGENFCLVPSFSPKDATFRTVVGWYSSDENVATVSEDGTVCAVATGTATISTYSSDGYFKSTCEVTVK